MRFHPRALVVTMVAGLILWLAVDIRVGIAAILALTTIDAFSFLIPLGFFQGRSERAETKD